MGHTAVSAIKALSVTPLDLTKGASGKYCKFAIFNMTVVSKTDIRDINIVTCKGDYSVTWYSMDTLFSFSFRGRVELLKYVYFCAQKSIIKAGKNKSQDLINAPRKPCINKGPAI